MTSGNRSAKKFNGIELQLQPQNPYLKSFCIFLESLVSQNLLPTTTL